MSWLNLRNEFCEKKHEKIPSSIILFNLEFLLAHCQVPCGIYDDAMRIMLIKEDFDTIKKAITEIDDLSKKNDPQSLNQLNRWIDAKDDHASNIQKIVSDYFLTQRIKKTNGNLDFSSGAAQLLALN